MAGTHYNYRLVITTNDGETIKLAGETAHDVKSMAGFLFHKNSIKRVYVGDIKGNHLLYLVKDENGHFVSEKFENIPSEYALFG